MTLQITSLYSVALAVILLVLWVNVVKRRATRCASSAIPAHCWRWSSLSVASWEPCCEPVIAKILKRGDDPLITS